MIETPVRNILFVSALVLGLVAAFPTVSPGGSTFVNVGGIDYFANQSSTSPTSSKIRERSQPVNAGSTSPDPSSRLIDRVQTGSTKSADKAATGSGASTISATNGRPTSPFCSTTDITIGEERRTTLRCSGGTIP
jgi:hypothetical protein